MFKSIELTVSLEEVLQVKGCPLSEDQLWTILRSIINVLADQKSHSLNISSKHILLHPSGKLTVDQKNETIHSNSPSPTRQYKLQDVALVILWCASYNLNESCPLSISSTLQSLLSTMFEQKDICTLDHVQEICIHHLNANQANDRTIILEMCSIILGNIEKWYKNEAVESFPGSNLNVHKSSISCMESSARTSNSSSRMSSMFGTSFTDDATAKTSKKSGSSAPSSSSASVRNHQRKSRSKESFLTPVVHRNIPPSVLKTAENSPTIHVDSDMSNASTNSISVYFVNLAQVNIITRSPDDLTASNVLQSALNVFLKSISTIGEDILKYFALGTWKVCTALSYHLPTTHGEKKIPRSASSEHSDFYFFDNCTPLHKLLRDWTTPSCRAFHVQMLHFPPSTNSIDPVILSAMYIQLRADIIHERVICSHDDALSFAALALQCELGDYKPEYGCNYFPVDEFLSPHVISKLGLSYIRAEMPAMHSQLAGIGQRETRLLFLRKCQKLDEYGMHFSKTYRLKSCNEDYSTYLGVGPKGIANFDLKGDVTRVKRHAFAWGELKKVSFQGRKLVLTRLNPTLKLKFYLRDSSRTKYLVTLIGNLHKFYSSRDYSNDTSAISLLDDMTKLSRVSNRPIASPDGHSTPIASAQSSSANGRFWTYNNPKFVRKRNGVRRASTDVSTSSNVSLRDRSKVDEFQPRNVIVGKKTRGSSKASAPGLSTREMVVKELKHVLEDTNSNGEVHSFSATQLSSSQNEPVNSPNSLATAADDDTDVFEADDRLMRALHPQSSHFHLDAMSQVSSASSSRCLQDSARSRDSIVNDDDSARSRDSNVNDDDIHTLARSFYRNSLTDSGSPSSPAFTKGNGTVVKSLVPETERNS